MLRCQTRCNFTPEQAGLLDYGSFRMLPRPSWINLETAFFGGGSREARPLEEYKAAGWAGVMSLPRVLTLGSEGKLKCSVAEEMCFEAVNKPLT